MNKIHNMSNSRPYKIWNGIKDRTLNPNNKDYKNYGARGITIDERWKESFLNFWDDMKEGYSDGLSIDRIDNNKGYTKDNCKWSTSKEQSNNRRSNRKLIIDNNEYTMSELADKYKITRHLLYDRLKSGWNLKEALTTPVKVNKKYTYKGRTGSLKEITNIFNKKYSVVSDRLRLGWKLEDAMELEIGKIKRYKGEKLDA